MKAISLRLFLVLFMAGSAPFSIAADLPGEEQCSRISIFMPYGCWNLVINTDGSGVFHFGQLPNRGKVVRGTFNFPDIYSMLKKKVSETRIGPAENNYGMVSFLTQKGERKAFYFYDWNYANSLFDKAWLNKQKPRNELEKMDLDHLAKFWEHREQTAGACAPPDQ